ncbi:MAG: Na(+)-translocating NADH-quinone reductase subunit C [Pirellulales bacterium]|nr:Na(+)-translocating NADH-quinone reductase subunit C [Pirellulales bacterium]
MPSNDTIGKTLAVSVGVCVVCSILVATSAVGLRERQMINERNDVNQNILAAAGFSADELDGNPRKIDRLFKEMIERKVVDLDTGEILADVDPDSIDDAQAARNSKQSKAISGGEDIAGIKRRPNRRLVYLFRQDGQLKRIILPVYGKGLWSTLYGFLALAPDGQTIESLSFYKHAETPGLGGEIDNPRWKAQWVGKKPFDENGEPVIAVIKGSVDPDGPNASRQIDGISGATLTGRGVMNLVRYWLSDEGYGPALDKLRVSGN